MNLPGVVVDLPTLTDKDVDDITHWAVPNDIDFIAASFVRKGSDIDNIRVVGTKGYDSECMKDGGLNVRSDMGEQWGEVALD